MTLSNTTKLRLFLSQLSSTERTEFAENCKTSVGYLNQIMYGNSKCSASLAINIDKESFGAVPCDDLCPEADFIRDAVSEKILKEKQRFDRMRLVFRNTTETLAVEGLRGATADDNKKKV